MTDEQFNAIMESIARVEKMAKDNREQLVYLTEEITGVKMEQKEMKEEIAGIKTTQEEMNEELANIKTTQEEIIKELAENNRKAEDYQHLNHKDHLEIIAIMENRFTTLQNENIQIQDNKSKMQFCHS